MRVSVKRRKVKGIRFTNVFIVTALVNVGTPPQHNPF